MRNDGRKVHFVAVAWYGRIMVASWTRSGAALVWLALTATPLLLNCDNGATGVDACQQIESKRCQAVVGCPGITITTQADVIQCQQLYRDQCLFGMADAADPDQRGIDACLAAIDAAAACKGSGAVASCTAPPALSMDDPAKVDACLLLIEPERLEGCRFLLPPEQQTTSTSTSGGSTGTSGGSAGAGGSGSAAGGHGGAGGGGGGGA